MRIAAGTGEAVSLAANGGWQSEATYGEVWYPKAVAADWAPYRYGRWRDLPPWGWTWIDDADWGFAPSHYGRWARIDQRWAWVPGTQGGDPAYSPAAVVFLGTAGIGLSRPGAEGAAVAWFPLAPGETVSADADAQYRNRRSATIVPRAVFAAGRPVQLALLELPEQRLDDAPVIIGDLNIAPVAEKPAPHLSQAADPAPVPERAIHVVSTPPEKPVPPVRRDRKIPRALPRPHPCGILMHAAAQESASRRRCRPSHHWRAAEAVPARPRVRAIDDRDRIRRIIARTSPLPAEGRTEGKWAGVPMIDFRSDNTGRAAPEILDALIRANSGTALGYGADDWTARLQERFSELFETRVRVFPVATGTAANALSLAATAPSWGLVFCSAAAHINTAETNAAGFFGGGLKLAPVAGEHGKIDADALAQVLAGFPPGQLHRGKAAAVSLTQASDLGAVYRLDEIRAVAEVAKARGLRLHMDGARFANALARLQCSPAELAWRSGIDILSFGATKNGGAFADAIIVFNGALADGLAVQLRRAGQVWSKMRFASAQLMAYIENGLWLRLAAASNRAAARIAAGIEGVPGLRLVAPVEANEIFLELPGRVMDALEADGFQFYRRSATLARFVCRFDVTDAEADALITSLKRHSAAPARAAE